MFEYKIWKIDEKKYELDLKVKRKETIGEIKVTGDIPFEKDDLRILGGGFRLADKDVHDTL